MKFRRKPEDILQEIGIYQPDDIDLELIAFMLGAEVKFSSLSDCEGYIIGCANKAIITINNDADPRRQRFSLGHELGHWVNDKGKNLTFRCDANDMKQWQLKKNDFRQHKEVRANQFSAELIMPGFLFTPQLANRDINFTSLKSISSEFRSSRTSTAIRIVELTDKPCMLICWASDGRRRWFSRSETLPEGIWPQRRVLRPNQTFASSDGDDVDADKWIEGDMASDHVVVESQFYNGFDWLTLLWWRDESQLLSEDE